MDDIRYRYIRFGVMEEQTVATIEDALRQALHDLEQSYAAPVAIIKGEVIMFDAKRIRSEYGRCVLYEERDPSWKRRISIKSCNYQN